MQIFERLSFEWAMGAAGQKAPGARAAMANILVRGGSQRREKKVRDEISKAKVKVEE